MSVPKLQSLLLPILQALGDGEATDRQTIGNRVAAALGLSEDDIRKLGKTGNAKHPVFRSRIKWGIRNLRKADLVIFTYKGRKSLYRLTEEGVKVLSQEPFGVVCNRFGEYRLQAEGDDPLQASPCPNRHGGSAEPTEEITEESPEETLARIDRELTRDLKKDILERIRAAPPVFLEYLIRDLLVAMGYGDGDMTQGTVTGGPGDGGIDGEIWQDKLRLDRVYFQAKRFREDASIGEPALRNFAGALDARGASKGVFITTATFSRSAEKYVQVSPKQIALVDGERLAGLMIQHGVGVRTEPSKTGGALEYSTREIDEDYFNGSS